MRGLLPTRTDLLLLAATLAIKLGILALGVASLWVANGAVPGLLEPWDRWDAPHYTDIAVFGYMADDPGTLSAPGYRQVYPGDLDLYIVFFPLYPWLVAAVDVLVGVPVVSAFVVSTIASLLVAPMLYRLVAADLGHRVGVLSAAFLLLFPTAYFLHIGYTESLFLALAFGTLWLARSGRWWAAGIAGGLAALTRINGLVLLPALAVEAWLQWRSDGRIRPATVAAFALVAAGFGVYLAVNWSVYGDPLAFTEIQREHWFKNLAWPWDGIAGVIGWTGNADLESAVMYGWLELAFIGLGFAATVVTAARWRPTWSAWMAGNWLLIVSTGFVLSVPRYAIVLFGIVVAAGVVADRRPAIGALLAIASGCAMAWLAWRFATGAWAF